MASSSSEVRKESFPWQFVTENVAQREEDRHDDR